MNTLIRVIMKNKLISASLLTLLSLSAHANDMKILHHDVKHVFQSVFQDYSKTNQFTTCTAMIDTAYGTSGSKTILHSHFNYSIVNSSIEDQTYIVTQDTCVINYGCDEIVDKVLVYPGKTGTYSRDPYFTFYLYTGTYYTEATIQITGESTNCYNYKMNYAYVK